MPKRKPDQEAIQSEHDEHYMSKKPRTDEGDRPDGTPDSLAQNGSTVPPVAKPAQKEDKEPRSARKVAKRLARKQRREGDARAGKTQERRHTAQGDARTAAEPSKASALRKAKKQRQKDKSRSNDDTDGRIQKPSDISSWRVSEPVGGQMLDLDPLFSLNEE